MNFKFLLQYKHFLLSISFTFITLISSLYRLFFNLVFAFSDRHIKVEIRFEAGEVMTLKHSPKYMVR